MTKNLRNNLPAMKVCERFDITRRTLERWMKDSKLNFPEPITINGRHYFEENRIETWERQRATASRKPLKCPAPAVEPRPTAA